MTAEEHVSTEFTPAARRLGQGIERRKIFRDDTDREDFVGRLAVNKDEEKILKKLSEHFHEETSALVKISLLELYENVTDLNDIKKFEAKERKGRASLFTPEDILRK